MSLTRPDFSEGTDLHACAQIVQKGDPDRFAATMAAPVAARGILFPIYAFNVEAARAPWVTQEALIAEMRLQWWADALGEIASGGPVRRHEVVTPLAEILDREGAQILGRSVEARRRDARRERVSSAAELQDYLAETSGALMWGASRALGLHLGGEAPSEARAMAVGTAQGLANYLLAIPAFLARNVNPLPEMSEAEFAELIEGNLVRPAGRPGRAAKIAELAAWRAPRLLKQALRDPAAAPEGRLGEAEALRRLSLALRAFGL